MKKIIVVLTVALAFMLAPIGDEYSGAQAQAKEQQVRKGFSGLIGPIIGGIGGFVIGRATAPGWSRGPRVVHYYELTPWSGDWYNYCASKFRSFDARTGYYTTYGGNKRFCQ